MKNIILILLLFGIYFHCNAQQPDTSKVADSTSIKTQPTFAKLSKDPMGAVWRSLAFPGWGQWYVESYWKAPIFFAGAAGLYGAIIWNNSEYQKEADYLTTLEKTHPDYSITKLRREYFRDNRDQSAFYLLVVYIFAAVDAYTGAHLYDFNVDDNFGLGYTFGKEGNFLIGLTIKF